MSGVRGVINEGYDRNKLKGWKLWIGSKIFVFILLSHRAVFIVAEKQGGIN